MKKKGPVKVNYSALAIAEALTWTAGQPGSAMRCSIRITTESSQLIHGRYRRVMLLIK